MAVLLVFLLVIGTIYSGEALYFEDGYDHHYTYSSESDMLGLHNITTIIKFRIRSVNDTDGGKNLHQLMVDSFVQISEKGYSKSVISNIHVLQKRLQTEYNDF
ncbi:uncharacterized protein LOC132726939 [Ruditapes philippinarum]|uniref:uncharacterized protein LOC132726939 n=1 Tax=Ruditapes philippinarum TaxID=129788 RepID=UPI00295BC704|nr:uncharacterized protein LOC132726939 [Ruditapes philippinarum]